MNHLKLFESFKKEDLYTDITEEEYLETDDKVDFENKYYSKLLELFWAGKTENNSRSRISPLIGPKARSGENTLNKIYLGYDSSDKRKSSIYGITCSARNSYPKSIQITQHKDYYFYVAGEVEDIMSGPYNPAFVYFRCDHFEGLLEFLKDHRFIST